MDELDQISPTLDPEGVNRLWSPNTVFNFVLFETLDYGQNPKVGVHLSSCQRTNNFV